MLIRHADATSQHACHSGACDNVALALSDWLIMVIAMMTPLLAQASRSVAERTLRRHAPFAVLVLHGGYLMAWGAAGIILLNFAAVLQSASGPGTPLILAAATLVWHSSEARSRLMAVCHRRPALHGLGWTTLTGCFLGGVRIGLACVGVCWAMMLLVMTMHDHFGPMVVVGGLVLAERLRLVELTPGAFVSRVAAILTPTACSKAK